MTLALLGTCSQSSSRHFALMSLGYMEAACLMGPSFCTISQLQRWVLNWRPLCRPKARSCLASLMYPKCQCLLLTFMAQKTTVFLEIHPTRGASISTAAPSRLLELKDAL